ncbi:uncharacterized protein LOC144378136 [Ictidomys tridecemlineatus]
MGLGGAVTSGCSLPPSGTALLADGLRNSPALLPALQSSPGGGGGGRDAATHSGGSSAPGLGCGVLGGGGSGGGSGPARAVTIVRSGRRSPAEPLSSRRRQRQPWPPALAPPAPGALRWLARLQRSAPARGTASAARPAPRPPRAHAHSQSRAGWFPCRLRYPGGRHKLLPTYTARWGSYGDAYHGDTDSLSHKTRLSTPLGPRP